MRVVPNHAVRAAAGNKTPADVPNQRWYALLKSLVVPVLVLAFFAAAPSWLNVKVRNRVIKAINSNARLSETQKAESISHISQIDLAAVCRDNPPEHAPLYAALDKAGVVENFQHLRWGFAASAFLILMQLAASIGMIFLNAAARQSQAALIRYYRIGWHISVSAALLQVLLLVPLLAYACYELPVILSNQWYPKLVIIVVLLGVVALWGSIKILLKPVPHQFNEPLSRRVTPEQAPELWHAVRNAAARLQTSPPDNILIGLQLNFYVTELAIWNGQELAQGRTLYISYPLLKQLPQEEIMAIIGHELGHFIGDDTRLTREFYPLRFKAHGTLVMLSRSVWIGWSSFQFLSFFGWCFGETEQAASRKRELLADKIGASLTSPTITARALVRFQALVEAFHQGLADSVLKGAQSPLDIPLHTVVREKLPSTSLFWTEILEKKLPHPMDSHPALHVRLESLGQSVAPAAAEALASEETIGAFAVWFAYREELFTGIRQEADAILGKMRSKAVVHQADYETAEGRAILQRHFPEKTWCYGRIRPFASTALLLFFALIFEIVAAVVSRDVLPAAIGLGLLGLVVAYVGVVDVLRQKSAKLKLTADSIHHTGWRRPLRFRDVKNISGRKTYGNITLTFHLKSKQPQFWKYALFLRSAKAVSVSLSGLQGIKQEQVVAEVFRYLTRQIPE